MLTLKLENLVALNKLQEKVTEEILSVILNNKTEWEHHSVSTSNSSCDGDTVYFSTPFNGGYILIMGSELYYSLSESDYTWCALVDYESIYLGSYSCCSEVYRQLEDMHYRINILSA